ncbi:MAG TPA: hypothetical protein VFB58_03050 [Chloroflexota bacterium]|nr:hypothetical protein [Chloroflexota bacterium]
MIRFHRGERSTTVIEPEDPRTAERLAELQRLIDIIPGQPPPEIVNERETVPVAEPQEIEALAVAERHLAAESEPLLVAEDTVGETEVLVPPEQPAPVASVTEPEPVLVERDNSTPDASVVRTATPSLTGKVIRAASITTVPHARAVPRRQAPVPRQAGNRPTTSIGRQTISYTGRIAPC